MQRHQTLAFGIAYRILGSREDAEEIASSAFVRLWKSAGEHRGEKVPQMWTYEHPVAGGHVARAFVWMQGHQYANFPNYQIQRTLLRGIAWAAKKPVDELIDYVAPPRPARPQGSAPPRSGQ